MIKVGIIGVGNCAAALVQGVEYYRKSRVKIGLIKERIGKYRVSDIDFVSAFDVDVNKVGKKLSEAIFTMPNSVSWVKKISVGKDVIVKESPVLDGVGRYLGKVVKPKKSNKTLHELKKEILKELETTGTEILINYLPVGARRATEFWASIALEAGCGFINSIPVFIASNPKWAKKFEEENLPVIGDDIKSQVGATIIHRALTQLCILRGAKINRTYQINVGGNTDFLNMLERERLYFKKISKTEAVRSLIRGIRDEDIYVGPSDFIPFLGNTKLAFIRIDGSMFAGIPFTIELKLEVDDKANSAGAAVDAIRYCKLALDRGIGGALIGPSAWLMKHPPIFYTDEDAFKLAEAFERDTQ
ncbi:MAG: inositol-3-phosphate synthase [Candidatus Nanoarchaeia archaeon]|nr:inositol-3-phosphate synthase [Candidatus Haiyanarchaeum thermophilum]MCW1303314.1 inositol-3-phosphate synthase [Candidatus Haiyanarchaeum thermophilum]MCW1304104.1 inositol-3-phosphate synthase [Candidatus Haiyanarchaeum thermophilum]MCW1306473.1 inositol-3-phosphate synthase [Candidatus Haiyanarchaeum thermophilum]MCW1307230.1 inositol-3-phosphate synthase [Candidatus Haiyanarchaeum thermophilum]